MASSTRGNLSDAIRDYLAAHPGANPTEIVEGLREQGTTVSRSLVNKLKYGGKRARRGRQRARATSSESKTQAAGAMTGTQAIQEYLRAHPHAGPKQIREDLSEKGISVSASLVSAVKYRTGRHAPRPAARSAARRMRGRAAAGRRGGTTSSVTLEQLLEVKRIADGMGGTSALREALDALEQFR